MGFLSFMTHRLLGAVLLVGAVLLGFGAYGMYSAGQSTALGTAIAAVVVGVASAYFFQTAH